MKTLHSSRQPRRRQRRTPFAGLVVALMLGIVAVTVPASTARAATAEDAVAWTMSQVGSTSWEGQCERLVEVAAGTSGRFPTAIDRWYAAVAQGRAHLDSAAPLGSLVFYRSTVPAGHVARSLGDGRAVGSSVGGRVGVVPTVGYWSGFLGWAFDEYLVGATAPPPPEGHVDAFNLSDDGRVVVNGWSAPKGGDGPSVSVELRVDGAVVASTPANIARPDVGARGFAISANVIPIANRRFEVVARNVSGTAMLFAGFTSGGYVDGRDVSLTGDVLVRGWAAPPGGSGDAVSVRLMVDGATVATTIATQPRADVGPRGFELRAHVDPNTPHQLRVTGVGTAGAVTLGNGGWSTVGRLGVSNTTIGLRDAVGPVPARDVLAGRTYTAEVSFRNAGTATLAPSGADAVQLRREDGPLGPVSVLSARMVEATVPPGAVGHLSFAVGVPEGPFRQGLNARFTMMAGTATLTGGSITLTFDRTPDPDRHGPFQWREGAESWNASVLQASQPLVATLARVTQICMNVGPASSIRLGLFSDAAQRNAVPGGSVEIVPNGWGRSCGAVDARLVPGKLYYAQVLHGSSGATPFIVFASRFDADRPAGFGSQIGWGSFSNGPLNLDLVGTR